MSICDPNWAQSASDLYDCQLILGATSGGATLEVDRLKPGTLVIDDSFPSAFSPDQARSRMEERGDVLLIGGGTLDVGDLERWSPFPQAEGLRKQFGQRWLPGCLAEAMLLGIKPDLGPTIGIVTLERALSLLDAIQDLGWRSAQPHLGAWVLPDSLYDQLR